MDKFLPTVLQKFRWVDLSPSSFEARGVKALLFDRL